MVRFPPFLVFHVTLRKMDFFLTSVFNKSIKFQYKILHFILFCRQNIKHINIENLKKNPSVLTNTVSMIQFKIDVGHALAKIALKSQKYLYLTSVLASLLA